MFLFASMVELLLDGIYTLSSTKPNWQNAEAFLYQQINPIKRARAAADTCVTLVISLCQRLCFVLFTDKAASTKCEPFDTRRELIVQVRFAEA